MSQDQEWMVRLQFLEEAQEYLDAIESSLIGLGNGPSSAQLDSALRATHSIKGGAAMMGFEELSHVGHRMEDFFKVLKAGNRAEQVNGMLEQLFLSGCDRMRQMTEEYQQRSPIDGPWLDANIRPILDQLYDCLGDPAAEDEVAVLSAEAGEDMRVMMFEEEVGPCLDRLEGILTNPESPLLRQEFQIASQELAGLGEMLDLASFASLCHQAADLLTAIAEEQVKAIAGEILQTLRRCHALVLIGQFDLIPAMLDHTREAHIETNERATTEFAPSLTEPSIDAAALTALWNDDQRQQAISETPILGAAILNTEAHETAAPTTDFSSDIVNTEAVVPAKPAPEDEENCPSHNSSSCNKSSYNSPQPSPSKTKETSSLRVSTPQIEHLSELSGELNTEKNGLNSQLKHMRGLVTLLSRRVKALDQANQQLRQSYDRVATPIPTLTPTHSHRLSPGPELPVAHPSMSTSLQPSAPLKPNQKLSRTAQLSHRFDSLEMDHYSDFHLLSQELIESVVQIQEVTHDLETALDDTEGSARKIDRTSQQMQVGMTQVRMRPLTEVTHRFPRMLRELSLNHGKEVALTVHGGGTLIERDILEALQDPLMHLLRNCFDHGLEAPSDRLAQGKSAQGQITIRSGYRGNQVFITIQDDGAGINLDKIRAKVRKMGLTEADIAASGEQELLNMIFEPGFSTADTITHLSGRGVGMDVVRTNLDAIRGSIQVETQLGQGTTFTITVPLSLSVTRVLIVESHNMLMAFPATMVEEMQLLNEAEIQTAANQEIVQWQGNTIPLVRLKAWMSFPRPPLKPETENTPIIDQPVLLVVSQGQAPYALQCDRYWGEQEVTTRTVDGNIALPPGFSGCVVLGDGRIVPLVDIEALLSWILQGGPLSQQAQAATVTAIETEQKTVMIVDDSITVRRFLAITLDKAGYRVEQAKDGQDAIEKLKGGTQPNAIICDIEMPRLDGFGFLGQVKGLDHHHHIPVMMLTSRSGDKHRTLAMNLGASNYFSKPFKKQELLKQLNQVMLTPLPNLAIA